MVLITACAREEEERRDYPSRLHDDTWKKSVRGLVLPELLRTWINQVSALVKARARIKEVSRVP